MQRMYIASHSPVTPPLSMQRETSSLMAQETVGFTGGPLMQPYYLIVLPKFT